MHCCCCCGAAVVLSYLVFFWCFVLCGSVNYRRRAEREREMERGAEREWYTKSESERGGHQQFPPFPQNDPSNLQLTFFVCYCYSFFYNFNFNYTNAANHRGKKTKKTKKKQQEIRKIKIANWRRRPRCSNATQRSAARRSSLPSVVSWLFVFVRCFISFLFS